MAATFWLIRRRVRRRALALVPLALIVAAGGAGALVALGTGSRTATAYDRYVQRADVGDLQINPALPSAEIDAVIRSLPGVRAVTTHVLLSAGPEAASASVADIDNGDPAQVRGSDDGRYATMDRPALAAGRLPTGPAEAVIDVEMAQRRGLHIGDVVPMSFFPAAMQAAIDDGEAPRSTRLTATGTERLTVVGIATLPDEVLPDGLYPRERMIVSPDIAARYDCTPLPDAAGRHLRGNRRRDLPRSVRHLLSLLLARDRRRRSWRGRRARRVRPRGQRTERQPPGGVAGARHPVLPDPHDDGDGPGPDRAVDAARRDSTRRARRGGGRRHGGRGGPGGGP